MEETNTDSRVVLLGWLTIESIEGVLVCERAKSMLGSLRLGLHVVCCLASFDIIRTRRSDSEAGMMPKKYSSPFTKVVEQVCCVFNCQARWGGDKVEGGVFVVNPVRSLG
ncbi:hypothetical protein Ae201684P_003456 [Aphanomyces euteiches]|uniref:Uncharacterized protein n=1 Tax=Aphanomyces euteiches TaxID=100861 RepID=A0A6G0WNV1_9STRA|nr:hypothetical protein Ae201684_013326 [Aphanomyces euteiches]KAH9064669.1 hypothetical protein Ae201684P_003456 [Aphanomyces euteiches]